MRINCPLPCFVLFVHSFDFPPTVQYYSRSALCLVLIILYYLLAFIPTLANLRLSHINPLVLDYSAGGQLPAGRYEDEFVDERRKLLQMWLDRMCKHPVVAQSHVFIHFLTCTDVKVRYCIERLNPFNIYAICNVHANAEINDPIFTVTTSRLFSLIRNNHCIVLYSIDF